MNRSLDQIGEAVRRRAKAARRAEQERLAKLAAEAEAAVPMIAAFRELEEQYVRVGVLRTIFPEDFDRRDDRVRSLLIEYLGDLDAELLTGVAFRIVGGEIRFRVSRGREDGLVYLATRSSGALRSNREFVLPGDWMDYFFRVMSELIEA